VTDIEEDTNNYKFAGSCPIASSHSHFPQAADRDQEKHMQQQSNKPIRGSRDKETWPCKRG